jgi:hypothetical protein
MSLLSLVVACESAMLKPGGIYNTALTLHPSENQTVSLELVELAPGCRYELRVSWPGTRPIQNRFAVEGSVDISDEKAVFVAQSVSAPSTLIVTALGVPRSCDRNSAFRYEIPLNISLERQYLSLTIHVWSLALCVFPILIGGIFLALRFFPLE